jgi:methylase of polypeptide subunit release factors
MAATTRASFDDIVVDIPGNKGIYPPSEDTFLLLDMVKRFVEALPTSCTANNPAVLDMGAGAGLATLYLARHFARVHAFDINPNAVAFVSSELARRGHGSRVDLIAGSLLDGLRAASSEGTYSLVCFNPPYLPPEDYESPGIQDSDDGREHAFYIDKALYAPDGGKRILEDFLRAARMHLVPHGHVFFIKSSLTGIEDANAWARGLGFTIVERTGIHRFFEDIEAYHAIA